MIQNDKELEIAFRHLKGYQMALEAVRQELLTVNPGLFPVVSTGYQRRIEALQSEIFAYLCDRPSDTPLTVRWNDVAEDGIEPLRVKATVS